MKIIENTKKTEQEKFMFAFPRAGIGDVKQFLKEHYTNAKPEMMLLKKAKESGLVAWETEVTVYKAFFEDSGRIEKDPLVLFIDDKHFVEKFKTWYFSEAHNKWLMEQSRELLEKMEGYYQD